MTFWDGVLWIAFVAAAAAGALQAVALRRMPHMEVWSRRSAWVAAALLAASFLWLVSRFIVLDLSYEYVFFYTGTSVPLAYRISGAWTGREGSLLLWTAYTGLAAAGLAMVHVRRPTEDEAERTGRAWTRLLLYGILAAFALAVARQGTFTATDPFLLTGRPGGVGLNPTLLSPFILIHPPLMFLAYALTAVPLAAVLAHMVTGTDRWSRIALVPSRIDWVLYTFAMGLGGLWAYYTLGFGGYWAWDPVEVANLLPWLALTVYLHAQLHHGLYGRYRTIGPLLGVLPFALTLFSTLSTRSGLWVSVHAFTDPTNAFEPDAAARLLGIIEMDPSLLPFFGIMVGAVAVGLALWTRRIAIDEGVMFRFSRAVAALLGAIAAVAVIAPEAFLGLLFEAGSLVTGGRTGIGAVALVAVAGILAAAPALVAPEAEGPRRRIRLDITTLLYGSVLALGLALVVAILWHLAAVNGWSQAFWEARVPWVVTPIALLLVALFLHGQRGQRVALASVAGAFAAALFAYLLGGLGAYALVLSIAVLAASMDKMRSVAFRGDTRAQAGSMLLWGAAVLDLAFWLSPPAIPLLEWTPVWPVQVFGGGLALLALAGAHRVGLGGGREAWPYVLAGALGGFYVALPMALAAWILHRRQPVPAADVGMRRIRPVAVYGIHLVVGILLVGYAASTYYDDEAAAVLASGDEVQVGPHTVRFTGGAVEAEPGTPWADRILPNLSVEGKGEFHGILYWEPQTGSHYPLPATLRTATGDLYANVQGVCFQDDGCQDGGWVRAYQASPRVLADAAITAVDLELSWLPGVGLVWASLILFAAYGAVLAVVPSSASKGP